MRYKLLIISMLFCLGLSAQNNWEVNPAMFEFTHNITGQVQINGEIVIGENFMLGAFSNGECRGIANIAQDDELGFNMFYLTVYGNQSSVDNLVFFLKNPDDEETELANTIVFVSNGITGSSDYPFLWMDEEMYASTDFLTYSIPQQVSEAVINAENKTIVVNVAQETQLMGLVADFTLAPGANAKVNSINQESGVSVNDFTNPLIYTVNGVDLSTENWTVTVSIDESDISDILNSNISVYPNPASSYVNVSGKTLISKVEIIDVSGKKMNRAEINTGNKFEVLIDISEMKSGQYFLVITDIDGYSYLKKLAII